jgi:exonuclease III
LTLPHRYWETAILYFSPIDESSRQKLNREMLELNGLLNQMDLTDVYRTFHPNPKEYAFFSSTLGTFSKINHILESCVFLFCF